MWCPCLEHLDELILKDMIKVYDGPTKGPNSWSGELGERIDKLANKNVKYPVGIARGNFAFFFQQITYYSFSGYISIKVCFL